MNWVTHITSNHTKQKNFHGFTLQSKYTEIAFQLYFGKNLQFVIQLNFHPIEWVKRRTKKKNHLMKIERTKLNEYALLNQINEVHWK